MEKKLLKRISYTLTIIGIILIILCSIGIYFKNKTLSFDSSGQLLEQVENHYQEMLRNYEQRLEIYKEDYLNRAYATDFILKHNADMRSEAGLNQIKDLMGVDAIHVVDHSGNIILSSEPTVQGINLFEYEESRILWNLIKGTDSNEFIVDISARSIMDAKSRDFIAVKSSVPEYATVHIGINQSIFEQLEDKAAIKEILKYMPTTYEQAVFAIDLQTGEIISQTINNEQTLDFKEGISKAKRLQKLKSASEGKPFKINDKWKFVKSKQFGSVLMVATEDGRPVLSEIYEQIVILIIAIVAIFVVVLGLLKVAFKKYVFNDLKHIEDHIGQIVTGHMNVQFKTENKEYESVVNLLNDWNESYTNKGERMSIIIDSIGSNVAVFECLYMICSNFFSNNIQTILGVDDTVWNKINKDPGAFERYIQELVSLKDEKGLIYVNDRYLEIQSYNLNRDFFGSIIDRTEEIKNNQEMMSELQEAKEAAQRDYLTHLLNRTGFENKVKKTLEQDFPQGIMMIYDLDNFKRINDNLGHPEGDKVLKLVANFLSAEFRKEDIVARLGGDEFVVFIKHEIPVEVLVAQLRSMLSRMRKLLDNYCRQFDVSMSIGVTYIQCPKNTYEDLYRYADEALYTAKKSGKNRFYIDKDRMHCKQQGCIKCAIVGKANMNS